MSSSGFDMKVLAEKGRQDLAVCIPFLIITYTFVGLRLYARGIMLRTLGWDDFFLCVTLAFFSALCGLIIYIAYAGAPSRILLPGVVFDLYQYAVITEILFVWTQICLKISVGLLFLRLMVSRWERIVIYVVIALSTFLNMGFFFVLVFQCGKPGDYLIKNLRGQCLPNEVAIALTYAQAATTTITDIIFALLPVSMVWNLHVNTRTKVSVWAILGLAAIGSLCSAVRFKYIKHNIALDDFFSKSTDLATWATAEAGAGIIAVGAIALKPMLRRFLASEGRLKFKAPVATWLRSAARQNNTVQPHRNADGRRNGTGSGPSKKTLWSSHILGASDSGGSGRSDLMAVDEEHDIGFEGEKERREEHERLHVAAAGQTEDDGRC